MLRLTGREIANHVKAFGGGFEIGIGELGAVGHRKIGARHFDGNDADLGIARGNFGGGKISGRDVVVIPEIQVNGLAAREEFPHLRGEDAEVRAAVGGGLGTRMSRENMQHAHAEFAVLILLAPDARGSVHQRSERAIGAAERPNARELLGIHAGALAHQADGGGHIAGFLNRGFDAGAERIRLRIIVAPQAAVFHVDGFRQIGGQRDEAAVGDVVHPLDDFRDAAARAGNFARLAEQRDRSPPSQRPRCDFLP